MILATTILALSLSATPPPHTSLLQAMCAVESNCDGSKVGDGGKAIGPYQIWEIYWTDAVKFDPSIGGNYEDCVGKEYSEKIILAYWQRYANEKRLGRPVTNQDRAKIHNGGPNALKAKGKKKKNLDTYWTRVQGKLNS